jgi:hypothetical protein
VQGALLGALLQAIAQAANSLRVLGGRSVLLCRIDLQKTGLRSNQAVAEFRLLGLAGQLLGKQLTAVWNFQRGKLVLTGD